MDQSLILLILPFIALALYISQRTSRSKKTTPDNHCGSPASKAVQRDPYEDIEPLTDFDWSTTPPIIIRPFKLVYHLTMALSNSNFSELVEIDNSYLSRMAIRRKIIATDPKESVRYRPGSEAAIFEHYHWIFNTYLPRRWPSMYELVSHPDQKQSSSSPAPSHLYNVPGDQYIPLKPSTPLEALRTLGEHVDADMLLLLPSSTAVDGSPVYHLEAFVTCFASGFSAAEKLGLPLADIHKPVPGYQTKLERSVDRFFARLEVGRVVKRANWTVTTNDVLHAVSGNHLYKGDEVAEKTGEAVQNGKTLDVSCANIDEEIARQRSDVVIDKCRLRCERQTLHRLPHTKALCFMFKTYQYRLEDVKAEGSGHELADAIEGLSKGSVPEMAFYKRGVVWGDQVVEYLRS